VNVIKIDPDRVRGPFDRSILGQFVEHYGSVVYGGLVDAATTAPAPGVARALRDLRMPLFRWPGGNFASGYHWHDGVGPRESRPVRYELEWQVEEPNTFGTDEFLTLCRDLGTAPYICANAGSGTAEEAARWVEYCNHAGRSSSAALRAANGHPQPWGVKLWGIGNEVYGRGQIGRQDVDDYIGTVREYARLMKKVDPTIRLVAVGWEREEWNFKLVKEAGEYFDFLALHSYHALRPTFRENMALALVTFEQMREMIGAIDAAGYYVKDRRGAPLRVAMDEWNLQEWDHERFIEWLSLAFGFSPANPELMARDSVLTRERGPLDPARMTEFLAQRRGRDDADEAVTLTDALHAAAILHEAARAAGRISVGGFSPTVNGKGLVGTRGGGMVLRPTYHVFRLLGRIGGGSVLDAFVGSDGYEVFVRSDAQNFRRNVAVPYLDALAVLDRDAGTLYLSVLNRHERDEQVCRIRLDGLAPRALRRLTLTAAAAGDANTTSAPDRVAVSEVDDAPGESELAFPPHSLTLLEYRL
jgi:alpha-L-arabinofuranosidase